MNNNENKIDIIIGIHSIIHALKNEERKNKKLLATEESFKILLGDIGKDSKDILKNTIVEIKSKDEFAKQSQRLFNQNQFEYQRIPSSLLLEAEMKRVYEPSAMFEGLNHPKIPLKVLALDSVSDINNGGAIARTCAFYGVDYLLISQKGSFSLTPSFYRQASGGAEYLKIIKTSNLAKTIQAMKDKNVDCIGFSEKGNCDNLGKMDQLSRCLILGSEDKGISHAVLRILDKLVSLDAKGQISTLNVSNAAAIVMDRYF